MQPCGVSGEILIAIKSIVRKVLYGLINRVENDEKLANKYFCESRKSLKILKVF
jgi:hypothetical protein